LHCLLIFIVSCSQSVLGHACFLIHLSSFFIKMKNFIIYLLTWISSNLSIPFWMIGHVHLTMNIYKDIHEIIASMGMNILVAIGFYLDWKKQQST
jgi:hypothetical protein